MDKKWSDTITSTLAHTLSQLIYKHFTIPHASYDAAHTPLDLDWKSHHWAEAARRASGRETSPLAARMESGRVSSEELGEVVYENLRKLKEADGEYVTFNHKDYPRLLRDIKDPPMALSLLGQTSILARPMVSVIGARRASATATFMARKTGSYLCKLGFTVVSGGAMGCDISAHLGAYESQIYPAATVVVLAGGLCSFYPKKNEAAFSKIRHAGGVFLSERLWHAPSRPFDFPVRNRIITGLSKSTILVQGALRSGAYLSTNIALNQGRDVFVLDHKTQDDGFNGNHELIRDGAPSFTKAAELKALLAPERDIFCFRR